jgi:hypothetical protein
MVRTIYAAKEWRNEEAANRTPEMWDSRARRSDPELTQSQPTEVNMFARSSSWTGSPEALQKWVDNAGNVASMIRGLPGVSDAFFFIDREGGSAMTLTLWDTEAAALASDRNAEASRASTVAATGVELVARGRYEVVPTN